MCVGNFGALEYAWRRDYSELWASTLVVGPAEESVVSEPGLQSKQLGQQVRTRYFAVIFERAGLQMARSNLYLGSVGLVDQQYAEQLGKTVQMPMMASGVSLQSLFVGYAVLCVGNFGALAYAWRLNNS